MAAAGADVSLDPIQQAGGVAEGFQKYGPYVFGLSLALVALAVVSWALLHAKNREVDRAEKRTDELISQVAALNDKRFTDRDSYQSKLDALAREMTDTIAEITKSLFALTRAVEELQQSKRKTQPAKESSG